MPLCKRWPNLLESECAKKKKEEIDFQPPSKQCPLPKVKCEKIKDAAECNRTSDCVWDKFEDSKKGEESLLQLWFRRGDEEPAQDSPSSAPGGKAETAEEEPRCRTKVEKKREDDKRRARVLDCVFQDRELESCSEMEEDSTGNSTNASNLEKVSINNSSFRRTSVKFRVGGSAPTTCVKLTGTSGGVS